MRQRKIKNLEERLLQYQIHFLEDLSGLKGDWDRIFFRRAELFLEVGCGKGSFLIKQAAAHPDRDYIGVEGQLSVVFRALQKLRDTTLTNVRFGCGFVARPAELFGGEELSGIYLNFSDPWPKRGHAGRRLTYRGYLAQFHHILRPGGFVAVKTDNDSLFDFTLEEARSFPDVLFETEELTGDLHGSALTAKEITSEYEEKFVAEGRKIHYVKLVKR